MAVQIQIRRGSAAEWTSSNPTLAEGEIGYETDTGKAKVGDGSEAWDDLPYRFEGGGGGGAVDSVNGQTGTVVITAAGISAQPVDADLTAIAALSGTGAWLKRTAANTWSLTTPTASDVGALDQTAGDARYSQLGHTHAYSALTGLPTLGTSAALNVAASGDAASGEVVKGSDTRLSDARTPTTHTHAYSALTGLPSLATVATSGSASDLGTGTLPAARLPSQTIQQNVFYATPANGTIVLTAKAAYAFTINQVRGVKTSAGSATLAVKINGTDVTGLASISATTSAQDVTATAANAVAAGDRITLVLSGVSSAAGLEFTLQATR